MPITITETESKDSWNRFIATQNPQTFLQGWEWGQVQKATGEEVRYLFLNQNGRPIAASLVITVKAKRGFHYLVPHGPLGLNQEVLSALVGYLKNTARRDRAVALRVAPLAVNNDANRQLFRRLGFIPAPLHVHAELTWVLDITPDEAGLLADMRKTTRHAIKKALASNLRAEVLTNNYLARFLPLYQATSRRHGFIPYSEPQLASQVNIFSPANIAYAVIVSHEGQDVAAAVLFQSDTTVFYYHGASRQMPSSLPAAHLVQWEAIREAKKRGATQYNFWGIAPPSKPRHPFAGITVFKKGFGGREIDYLHAQDLPLNWKYKLLWLIDSYRKIKRGF